MTLMEACSDMGNDTQRYLAGASVLHHCITQIRQHGRILWCRIVRTLYRNYVPHPNATVESERRQEFWGGVQVYGVALAYILMLYPGTAIISHYSGGDVTRAEMMRIAEQRTASGHYQPHPVRTTENTLVPGRCDLTVEF